MPEEREINGGELNPAIITQDDEFNKFLMTLPENQRQTPENKYYTYKMWKIAGKPKDFNQAVDMGLYHWNDNDRSYHGNSVIYDEESDVYHFLKPKDHSTVQYELDWYNKGVTTDDNGNQYELAGDSKAEWEDFRRNYYLDSSGDDYAYRRRSTLEVSNKARNSIMATLENGVKAAQQNKLSIINQSLQESRVNKFGNGGNTVLSTEEDQPVITDTITQDNYNDKINEMYNLRKIGDYEKANELNILLSNFTLEQVKGSSVDPMLISDWDYPLDESNGADFEALMDLGIRFEDNDVNSFLKSYVESEGFDRVRNNQLEWWKKRHPYRKLMYPFGLYDRGKVEGYKDNVSNWANYKTNYVLNGNPENSFSRNGATYTYRQYNGDNLEAPFDFVQMHEFDHLFNRGISNGTINSEVLEFYKHIEPEYNSKPDEKHSDVLGTKYLLFREGIHDVRGNKDITPEEVQKLRDKYPQLRFLQQMNNEDAAFIINNVASNTKDSNRLDYVNPDNIAAFGGRLNRFGSGGQIPPTTPQFPQAAGFQFLQSLYNQNVLPTPQIENNPRDNVWSRGAKAYDSFDGKVSSLERSYRSKDEDDSDRVKITATNTDISKFLFGNEVSVNALKEVKRVSELRSQDPYDVLAHMLIEQSGTGPITTSRYYNTHNVIRDQIPSKYTKYYRHDNTSQLKQLGIYNDKKSNYTDEEIEKAFSKLEKERNEYLDKVIIPESSIDAVALHMLLKGRDFNPAQKGFVDANGKVKHTYLEMVDSAIQSLKKNMPDLFENL